MVVVVSEGEAADDDEENMHGGGAREGEREEEKQNEEIEWAAASRLIEVVVAAFTSQFSSLSSPSPLSLSSYARSAGPWPRQRAARQIHDLFALLGDRRQAGLLVLPCRGRFFLVSSGVDAFEPSSFSSVAAPPFSFQERRPSPRDGHASGRCR